MRAGDLGVRVVRVVGEVGVKSRGALVRIKAEGLEVEDSLPLERLVERVGSMFSASMSSSKTALRFVDEARDWGRAFGC